MTTELNELLFLKALHISSHHSGVWQILHHVRLVPAQRLSINQ